MERKPSLWDDLIKAWQERRDGLSTCASGSTFPTHLDAGASGSCVPAQIDYCSEGDLRGLPKPTHPNASTARH